MHTPDKMLDGHLNVSFSQTYSTISLKKVKIDGNCNYNIIPMLYFCKQKHIYKRKQRNDNISYACAHEEVSQFQLPQIY